MAVESVLLVTVDALRADHCGFMGYGGATTPFLDSLADESLVFESAFAVGPGTPSSFASLFSSRYPLEFGGYEEFSATRPSLPEHLGRRGVTTAGVHSNPYLSRHYGYDRGFDHFEDSFEETDEPGLFDRVKTEAGALLSRSETAYRLGRRLFLAVFDEEKPYVDATETTDRLLDWHADAAGRSFAWAHYLDVHGPYLPPDEYLDSDLPPSRVEALNEALAAGESDPDLTERDLADLEALYDGELRYVDAELERLFGTLEGRGRLGDTAVVVTADHGEEFMDHGHLGHHPHLYDELVHVPLLVWLPPEARGSFDVDTSGRTPGQVSLLDVAPTVTDLLGIEPDSRFGGRSALRESGHPVVSEVSNPHGVLKVDERFRRRSVREDGWKLVVGPDGEELYDLAADPGEREDLGDERPDRTAELRTTLAEERGIDPGTV
ncbi:sulfatase [Salinirubellus sp. GCM10025818]|uniref:sulfatase n=1 Tax=Salinirubellus TaxID=2162630 RepID=UPI0030D4BD93